LIRKIKKAIKNTGIKQVAIAGGVAANSELRKRIADLGNEQGCQIFIPKFEYCTDNAAMIAITAHYKFLSNQFENQMVTPNARMVI
jgi:N6-L-threonylcarbamoyladenine synthase